MDDVTDHRQIRLGLCVTGFNGPIRRYCDEQLRNTILLVLQPRRLVDTRIEIRICRERQFVQRENILLFWREASKEENYCTAWWVRCANEQFVHHTNRVMCRTCLAC